MREIALSGFHGEGKVALVDDADYDLVKDHTWWFHPTKGVYARIGGKMIKMSRLIMNFPVDMEVDHINHNCLDNRRENLRPCTRQENSMNRRAHRNSSSKFVGVCWYSRTGKWQAQIGFNGRIIHLGYFVNEEDAARAYDKAACELFGEYACLNFPCEILNEAV